MSNKEIKIGRLAMRHEGSFWNAYYMLPDTNKGGLLLGSAHMVNVMRSEERKQAFMKLMREFVGDIIEEQCGTRPTWGGEVPAPEHERSKFGHG